MKEKYFTCEDCKKELIKKFEKIIDKCKIHTAGALILIEKKELLNKLEEKK